MIKESELILNSDGSIYHLQLKPGEVAKTIITVGDPDRVDNITSHFDSITVNKRNREFKTVTGMLGNKRLTVIATGIGTDNIDIVFNELDALFNIDFKTRTIKDNLISLDFIRIGTSGSINPKIPVNSIVVSQSAVGLDGLLNFYNAKKMCCLELESAFKEQTDIPNSYAVQCSAKLLSKFESIGTKGITITADGFYGPQSRNLRLDYKYNLVEMTKDFSFEGTEITNLEMETAGIYGLAKMLGHNAISLNAILASRCNGEFSNKPSEIINDLIQKTLQLI
jgi:uridine phosphorylase